MSLTRQQRYYASHRDQERERKQRYRQRHPDRVKATNQKARRKHYIKTKYGLTVEEYAAAVSCRECAVCSTIGDVVLDHSHRTGKIRGTLCSKCNLALGLLQDDAKRILDLAAYLGYPVTYPERVRVT